MAVMLRTERAPPGRAMGSSTRAAERQQQVVGLGVRVVLEVRILIMVRTRVVVAAAAAAAAAAAVVAVLGLAILVLVLAVLVPAVLTLGLAAVLVLAVLLVRGSIRRLLLQVWVQGFLRPRPLRVLRGLSPLPLFLQVYFCYPADVNPKGHDTHLPHPRFLSSPPPRCKGRSRIVHAMSSWRLT